MKKTQTIFFFTNQSQLGRIAFDLIRTLAPDVNWKFFALDPGEKFNDISSNIIPNAIISFLNPYIIPDSLLQMVSGRAFNVHPASPDYPGRDPQHFAFYEGCVSAAATIHKVVTKVDSGEIIDVLEAPINRREGVMRSIACSEHLSLAILIKHLPAIITNNVKPQGVWKWRLEKKTTRKNFLSMCQIHPEIDPAELKRRIEAFFNPDYRSVHVKLHGFRFIYQPESNNE